MDLYFKKQEELGRQGRGHSVDHGGKNDDCVSPETRITGETEEWKGRERGGGRN